MYKKEKVQYHQETGELYKTETGEMVDGFALLVPRKKRNGFWEGWFAMALNGAALMAKWRKELGMDGYAVFFQVLAKLRFENEVVINQAEVGRELGMQRQNVQQAIKRLIAVGILLEGPKQKQNRTYQLNPNICWRGSSENHIPAIDAYRTEKTKIAKIISGTSDKDPK